MSRDMSILAEFSRVESSRIATNRVKSNVWIYRRISLRRSWRFSSYGLLWRIVLPFRAVSSIVDWNELVGNTGLLWRLCKVTSLVTLTMPLLPRDAAVNKKCYRCVDGHRRHLMHVQLVRNVVDIARDISCAVILVREMYSFLDTDVGYVTNLTAFQ